MSLSWMTLVGDIFDLFTQLTLLIWCFFSLDLLQKSFLPQRAQRKKRVNSFFSKGSVRLSTLWAMAYFSTYARGHFLFSHYDHAQFINF
jgi:hypothetical protein